jgi:hypothetical protein
MLHKPGARILIPFLSVTALNVAILFVNLSLPSKAAVANMDHQALSADADFKRAVQTIIEACSVNIGVAKVKC